MTPERSQKAEDRLAAINGMATGVTVIAAVVIAWWLFAVWAPVPAAYAFLVWAATMAALDALRRRVEEQDERRR